MSESSEREPNTTPALSSHGSLDDLTHGAGTNAIEKASSPDRFTQ
jgi:hypothetical protein